MEDSLTTRVDVCGPLVWGKFVGDGFTTTGMGALTVDDGITTELFGASAANIA